MAELYARQGHMAEAVNVYRVLRRAAAAMTPGSPSDSGNRGGAGGGERRLSYVAVDTGGESVESFFRSLATRVRGRGVHRAPPRRGCRRAAPTRPANDPLSLSAIFGEERQPPPPPPTREPPAARRPDAFSFDQFFGGAGAGAARVRGAPPLRASDEDLDQFQHWLKSLKR